jgi:hypothetical protein
MMEASNDPAGMAKAPLHLWLVGGASLLWNGLACYDYLMTNVRDVDTIARFPPDMVDYLDALPAWVIVAWAMVVGFATLGSLLLLGRSLWAAYAFALSLLGLAAMQAYQLVIGLPEGMNTPLNWLTTGAIWIIALGLLFYALRMRANLVLR